MTEPSKEEEKTMAYGTEIQEILGRGYGEVGSPWRIAEERKSVGIGKLIRSTYHGGTRFSCLQTLMTIIRHRNFETSADGRNRILLRPPETAHLIRSFSIRPSDTSSG